MELKDCFVIMPFSASVTHTEEEWTEIFEDLFAPIWSEFNVKCHRANISRGSITRDIIEKLYTASVVFADLTDSNPNVMYELGVRHAFRKPSIMVKQKGTTIPFDVNDYNVFEYKNTSTGLKNLKDHIKNAIDDIEQYPNRSDNPVGDFLHASDFIINFTKNVENIEKLEAIKEEFENNLKSCDNFLDEINGIKLPKDTRDVVNHNFSDEDDTKMTISLEKFFPSLQFDALKHWIITRYVNFPDQYKKILIEIYSLYIWCSFYSNNLFFQVLVETEKQKITELKKLLPKGISIINERIAELEVK